MIKQFYLQFEQIVAGLLERMTPADALIVLSDHGQRRRCERVFNLNEFLRAEGLLVPDVRGPKYLDRRYLLERGKSFALRAVYRLAVEEQAYKLAGKLPNRKSLRTSAHVIARGTSVAWASDIGGTNPFGGVVIDRAALGSHGLDYDRVVSAVCDGLTAASVDCGIRPVLWAAPRDAVYHGERITDFPDVLFEMLPEYGVGFSLYDGLSGPNTMHRRISGGHRRAAFFGVHAPSGDLSIPAAVEDVAGYVLALLGDPMRFQCGE